MSTDTKTTTAEQLFAMPKDGWRYDLRAGELNRQPPAVHEHGRVAINLSWRLAQHVHKVGLGAVYAAETGFILSRNPDTLRAPDLAFVRAQRAKAAESTPGFFPGHPDLVIEVLSPSDSFSDVEEKVLDWLNAGRSAVVLLDPQRKRASSTAGPPRFRS